MLAIHAASAPQEPTKHTTRPIVTGTTVIGMKYNGGVMLASDTLASYGSLARYKDVRRIQKVGENCLVGGSGELSDFQTIMEMLEQMDQSDINQDDGYTRNPSEIFNYLRAVMYQRRNKSEASLTYINSKHIITLLN
jgi:20S proteasome subunit beta 7